MPEGGRADKKWENGGHNKDGNGTAISLPETSAYRKHSSSREAYLRKRKEGILARSSSRYTCRPLAQGGRTPPKVKERKLPPR